jgi:hypothetical protein
MSGDSVLSVVAVIDDESGCEAIYVDYRLKEKGNELFLCDLAALVEGRTITFEHVRVRMTADAWEWPKSLNGLDKYRVGSKNG